MNILYLLFSFTTGGTERLVVDICNQMHCRGHNVHLYVVNDLYDPHMLENLDSGICVYLQKRPAGGNDKAKTLLSVARYVCKHKIDVIHCNSLNAPELLLLKPVLFPRVKVLYTVHSMSGYPSLSKSKINLRNCLCHRLIAISESVRQEMLRCGAAPEKLVTIYNAIDLQRFPLANQKPFQPDAPVIGNVARIDCRIKGQDILIQAVAQLRQEYPDIQCLFAGAPDAAHLQDLEDLQSQVRALGLEDSVHFLGNVEDIYSFLQQLDLFVLPSRSEGFGISLVEALAMEIPCIASNLDGPTEVLQDGQYGMLFQMGAPEDLAQKLRLLLSDYASHRSAAREYGPMIRQRYNIVTMCDLLEAQMR